jgi:protein-disulfide isomerase
MSFHFSIFPGLRRTGGALLLALLAVAAAAQDTLVHDASALHPPAGARVAIVEFADMECPQCAHDNPILQQAVAQYHIPWVRHDFPLHQHIWSNQAAINARWFDAARKGLGDEYRNAVFASQISIYNLNVLNTFTQSFAKSHGVTLPFAVDPQGKFSALVKADYDLGVRIGIDHTPTVWVVTEHSKGAPYIEVPTDLHNLYQVIDQALADTKAAAPAAAAKKPLKK